MTWQRTTGPRACAETTTARRQRMPHRTKAHSSSLEIAADVVLTVPIILALQDIERFLAVLPATANECGQTQPAASRWPNAVRRHMSKHRRASRSGRLPASQARDFAGHQQGSDGGHPQMRNREVPCPTEPCPSSVPTGVQIPMLSAYPASVRAHGSRKAREPCPALSLATMGCGCEASHSGHSKGLPMQPWATKL